MSDPFYLADILLGRVGVLRSTAESIILELCEAQAKLDASGGAAASDEEALRLAIKSKLERVQTNLKLLRKLVPEFGGSGESNEGRVKCLEAHIRAVTTRRRQDEAHRDGQPDPPVRSSPSVVASAERMEANLLI